MGNNLKNINYKGEIFKTIYNEKIIELLVERKGLTRARDYLTFSTTRAKKFLDPLFKRLNKKNNSLKVLEVGCSSGHISEYIHKQSSVKEIYSFDVDLLMTQILREKKKFLGLDKIKSIDNFNSQECQKLPYENESFDLVLVFAVVEHLPYENRHLYVDEYYRVLKKNGLIGFFDTPNKHFPIERHSIGLPFVSKMSPEIAYIYSRVFLKRKYKDISFIEFMRPGGGWRNSSYLELLPKSNQIIIKDVSENFGYLSENIIYRFLSWLFRCPQAFFVKNLNVIFKKLNNLES